MNLKRIYKHAVLVLIPLSFLSAFYEWKRFPISILMGGVLGLLNLKGLAWALKDFAEYRPTGKVIFSSIARFFVMASLLILLVMLKVIHPVGILIGFTVVFFFIIIEGLRIARESSGR